MSDKPGAAPAVGRRLVLMALRDAGADAVTASHLAEQLGVHVNTVRFHLEALIANGQAERVVMTPTTPGRPPHGFVATATMDPSGPRRYRELAQILAADLADRPDQRRRSLEIGKAWGRRAAEIAEDPTHRDPTDRLVTMLDELDFAPEPRGDDATIRLRHCPFLELSTERSDVVCSIHLGLMQGALERWDVDDVVIDRLDPFVEPDLCLVHVAETKEAQ